MRLQLRQRLQAGQHSDGDQLTGPIVQYARVEDVPEDEAAQDTHQFRVVVRRACVTWAEQTLIGGIGVRLTRRHLQAVFLSSHGRHRGLRASARQRPAIGADTTSDSAWPIYTFGKVTSGDAFHRLATGLPTTVRRSASPKMKVTGQATASGGAGIACCSVRLLVRG